MMLLKKAQLSINLNQSSTSINYQIIILSNLMLTYTFGWNSGGTNLHLGGFNKWDKNQE